MSSWASPFRPRQWTTKRAVLRGLRGHARETAHRIASGVLVCRVLGSSVPGLRSGDTVLVNLGDGGRLTVRSNGRVAWSVAYDDVDDVQIYGSGPAVAADTRLSVSSASGAITLMTTEASPSELDAIVGDVLARVRRRSSAGPYRPTIA